MVLNLASGDRAKNFDIQKTGRIWSQTLAILDDDIKTSQNIKENVYWQPIKNSDVVAEYCGFIFEISEKEITILFENDVEKIKEAYSFNRSYIDFDVSVNDLIMLREINSCGKISFEFSKYKKNLNDTINDIALADRLLHEEENYDI